jgi:anti-sigma B factor antagonist
MFKQDLLSVSRQTNSDFVIVTAAGEVDMLTVGRLRSAVAEGLREPVGRRLIVDLTRVTFLGANGLIALVEAATEARRHHEPLRIVVDHQRQVVRPLQITGLDRVLALYDTVEDAIRGKPRSTG